MDRHRAIVAPKFATVVDTFERHLGGTGVASWIVPKGGYFISLDVLDGCAKEVVRLATEAGVALTPAGAWFTNSSQPELYFVPITNGHPGEFTTLHLSGPAAVVQPDGINNNGIQATSDGSTLVVSHSSSGALNVVNPNTGTSRTIDDLSLPNVDGILMEGRTLYAAQTFQNRIAEVRLSGDLTSGSVRKVITSSLFEVPTTVALFGDRLAAVNAKFDTGLPPDATSFEVVVVDR